MYNFAPTLPCSLRASTLFFVVISIFCAWICARFAPNRSARHVLWFLLIGALMGIATIRPAAGKTPHNSAVTRSQVAAKLLLKPKEDPAASSGDAMSLSCDSKPLAYALE